MNRRTAVRSLGVMLAIWACASRGQVRDRVAVVGIPLIAAGPNDRILTELRQALRERGYVDGENIRIEYRSAEGKIERLPAILQELVQLNVDVIVAGAEPIVKAAKQATSTIPIVMIGWDYDPVSNGFVESLSRPGGNLTGVYLLTEETAGKRLQLLKETIPGLSRVALLHDASLPSGRRQFERLEAAANALKLKLQPIELQKPYDYATAFEKAKVAKVEALTVLFSPRFYVDRQRIADMALARRLPTMFEDTSSARAGGLISYGPSTDGWQRAGYFIDRILKGTAPKDLPVEAPAVYSLVINMKTAKALRIKFPESFVLRADEVIR